MGTLLLLAAASHFAQEPKDNPRCEYWKDCKPGSRVTAKMEMIQGAAHEKQGELTPEGSDTPFGSNVAVEWLKK